MTRGLCVLLVLMGTVWPTFAQDAKPLTTILLVARPELPDPNFRDSVVLVMNHIGLAPAGVIINRPTRIPVSHLFPDVERLAKLDDRVYFGGPVDLEVVSFLFRADKAPEHATQVLDGLYLSANRDLLRELLGRERPMEGLRIFVGYSGWARGQLEVEIARGDWTLAPADPGTIFETRPEHPWPERQGPAAGQRASRSIDRSGNAVDDVLAQALPPPSPALIVWGEDDRVFDVSGAADLHRRIPGSEVHRLPRAGHLLHMESAGVVAPIYAALLRRVADLANPASLLRDHGRR